MRERRHDVREAERARVIIRGTHGSKPFEEQTETIDVSALGLSFYLKTPIFVRTLLSIEIASSKLLAHIRQIQALVVRIDTSSPGKQLIGAQFL